MSAADQTIRAPHGGERCGGYELIRRLAVGGMAEVFLARRERDREADREGELLVLKRMLPQLSHRREFVSMFLDEARLAAAVRHPNVVDVRDIGRDRDSYFFTMEFIWGEDLRRLQRVCRRTGRRIPLSHVTAIIAGAAAGLHAAHETVGPDGAPLGIIHRDVSPSNVLVSLGGRVVVIDFGVAKAARRESETGVGTLKGKVAYMSPEQCRCLEDIDRRSDVFALGILLYELSTARRLYAGDSEFSILNQVVYGDVVPPSEIDAGYPLELEAIVLRALDRDRDRRYPTAQALARDLDAFARRRGEIASSAELAAFMQDVFAAGEVEDPVTVTAELARDSDDDQDECDDDDDANGPALVRFGAGPAEPDSGRRRRSPLWGWVIAAIALIMLAAAAGLLFGGAF